MWYVGQEVVCIDDSLHKSSSAKKYNFVEPLIKGQIYTIREVLPDYNFKNEVALGLKLVGVDRYNSLRNNYTVNWDTDLPFGARRFRPVQKGTTKQGMTTLKSLLNSTKVSQNA